MKEFNVIIEDINSQKFVPYNVIPYLERCYYEEKDRPSTLEEFKTFIERHSKYQWWSRCEYEVVLKSWPCGNFEKKIDVHQQVMMNLEVVAKVLMEQVSSEESSGEDSSKCPECGSRNLSFYAFSFCTDCGVRCEDCGYEIESEVSWEGCASKKEHDERCYDHLIKLLKNEA